LMAADPQHLQRNSFGLGTSDQIICRRCGVYVAMTLADEVRVWSVVNVDTLDDRALFTGLLEARITALKPVKLGLRGGRPAGARPRSLGGPSLRDEGTRFRWITHPPKLEATRSEIV
jgi:hypothetical protein